MPLDQTIRVGNDVFNTFFSQTGTVKYVTRAIYIDLELTICNEIYSGLTSFVLYLISIKGTIGINNYNLIALRNYVMSKYLCKYNYASATIIILDITYSNLKQYHYQIQFNLHITVNNLYNCIYWKTGTHPPS